MTKIPNSKPVLVIEYWNLRFICNLVLGIWDFGMGIPKCEMTIKLLSTTDSWILCLFSAYRLETAQLFLHRQHSLLY